MIRFIARPGTRGDQLDSVGGVQNTNFYEVFRSNPAAVEMDENLYAEAKVMFSCS